MTTALDGKVALVTGAGAGIGLAGIGAACVRRLFAEGASIVAAAGAGHQDSLVFNGKTAIREGHYHI
jgi:NAD(P)-dependent dehydrogenase (short-subunit alcohol dehydrogenase family)